MKPPLKLPPIEQVTDELEYTKRLVECSKSCSYFVEQFLGLDKVFDYNKVYLDCEERFIVYRCIEENEYVYCNNGIKQLKDLKNGDNILGGEVDGIHKFKDNIIEIKFDNGVKIKVNKEHPFYTKNGWVNAEFLTVNDKVEFTSSQKFRHGVKSIGNNNIIKLMGYLHSDGSICNGREIRFVNTNKDLIDEVIDLSTKEFDIDINYRIEQYNNWKPSHRLRFISKIKTTKKNSNPLMKFIRDNNLMQKETFGESILSLPRDELKQFINGYFNGDGSLIVSQKNRNQVHVKFCIGVSRQRAYEFQFMLWKLGIDSLVTVQHFRKSSTCPYYEVAITRINNVKKILEWLDSRKYPDKFEKAKNVLNISHKPRKHNIFVKIKSITNCGDGNVIGFEVNPTHEIYSYLGMRTHNSGRQVGKSRNAALKAIHFGYFAPLKASNLDEGECNVVIASITKDQAYLIFKKIANFIHKSRVIKIIHETKTDMTIEWFDGSGRTNFIVRPIGDTGESLRGYTTHMAILDEAAYISEIVYNAFIPSSVTTKPRILLTSTPKGKFGAFFNACEKSYIIYRKGVAKVLHAKDKNYKWVQFHVTTYDNPLAASDPEVMDLIKSTSKAAEKQELLGEFLDGGNAIVPYNLLQEALVPYDTRPKFSYYEMGVDISGKGSDETVLTIVGITEDGKVFPVDCYTELTTDQTKFAIKIKEFHNTYNCRRIYYDETGIGDTLGDIVRDKYPELPVYGVIFTSEKTELYVNLERLFEEKSGDRRLINMTLLEGLHHDKMIEQIAYMYWDYGKFKDQQPKAKSDNHDDYPDSLALACYGQRKGAFIQDIPNFWEDGYGNEGDFGW